MGRCTHPQSNLELQSPTTPVSNADILHFPLIGYMTFSTFSSFCCLIEKHKKDLCHRLDTPLKTQQVNNTRQVTQITYAVLYKHSALLSHCLHLCIIPQNVCKCYKDYFHSTPIYSYPSTCSLLYSYTKELISRNYFHFLLNVQFFGSG